MIMGQLAASMGGQYFHFLQPNQYVRGSKEMAPAERQLAIDPGHPYAGPAAAGYPFLIEAGRQLAARGTWFKDLTMLFAGERRPLYSDACCHLNRQGYQAVASRIGSLVRETLDGAHRAAARADDGG